MKHGPRGVSPRAVRGPVITAEVISNPDSHQILTPAGGNSRLILALPTHFTRQVFNTEMGGKWYYSCKMGESQLMEDCVFDFWLGDIDHQGDVTL